MSKYRLRRLDTGTERIADCVEAVLAERLIGKGPVKIGSRFRNTSKLDGSRFVEVLVGIQLKATNTDYGGISHHQTWPMRSYSMAIEPEDIPAAMKADAELGIQIEYDQKTGDAIFTSPGKFKRYCEAHGFVARNGGYQDPQRRDERERDNMGLPQLAGKAECGNAPIMLDEMLEQMQQTER